MAISSLNIEHVSSTPSSYLLFTGTVILQHCWSKSCQTLVVLKLSFHTPSYLWNTRLEYHYPILDLNSIHHRCRIQQGNIFLSLNSFISVTSLNSNDLLPDFHARRSLGRRQHHEYNGDMSFHHSILRLSPFLFSITMWLQYDTTTYVLLPPLNIYNPFLSSNNLSQLYVTELPHSWRS